MTKQEVFNRMKLRKCYVCGRDCFNYKSFATHMVGKHKGVVLNMKKERWLEWQNLTKSI